MTQEQFKALDPKVASHREELIRSQQGELNAVLMYQRLAKVVKTDKERETPTGEVRVVGEVVNLTADESVLNEKGRVDFDKLHLICFDEATLTYRRIGEVVGNAFVAGNKIRKG